MSMQLKREGVNLGDSQALVALPAGTQLTMLRDQLLLKVLPWQLSTIIIAPWAGRPNRGEVVASGPGCYPWRYNRDRSRRWQSKSFRRTDVLRGDIVDLGALERGGAPFQQVMIGHELHIICREEDVCYVTPAALSFTAIPPAPRRLDIPSPATLRQGRAA